jgi:hypothetical protein
MRGLGLLAGIAAVSLAAPGSGVAAPGSHSSSKLPSATVSSVARAFAVRGIPLRLDDQGKATQGPKRPKVLWNEQVASSQGVVSVVVFPSSAEAKATPERQSVAFDCAGFPASYATVRSRNVVATYTECFNLGPPIHLATNPVLPH